MLSETKTGGVLERGWAHPAGSFDSGVCRAVVGVHAARTRARRASSKAVEMRRSVSSLGGMPLRMRWIWERLTFARSESSPVCKPISAIAELSQSGR